MASVNKVFLMGNLTRDVDLRYTQQNKAIAEFTVAANRRGGDHEETCYVDVVAWGKVAENCRRYIGKGSCVYVEGYLKQDRWEDRKTGQSRNKLRVVAESVQFLTNTRGGQTRATDAHPGNSGPVSTEYGPPPQSEPVEPPKPRFYGDPAQSNPPPVDDIPF